MTNEITVTRAPRLPLVSWEDLKTPCWVVDFETSIVSFIEKDYGTGFKELSSDQRTSVFVEFESFEAMCKWVANGRKLEDLAGDGRDEWVPAGRLPVGSFGVVMEMWGSRNPGDVVRNTGIGDFMLYDLGSMQSNSAATKNGPMIVWPLKEGDSITITPKNP